MATSMSIELPWPAKPLHPNARPHHMVKWNATKKARADAYILAKRIGKIDAEAIKVTCIFFPPLVKRYRDLDNMNAACKAYLDGIADAIGINDKCFLPQAPAWGIPVKGGKVRIVLEAA